MIKTRRILYIFIFLFTCLFCFGHRMEVNNESNLRFKPNDQIFTHSLETEIITNDDTVSTKTFRRISDKELLLHFRHFRCKNEMDSLLQIFNLNNDSVSQPIDEVDEEIYNKWRKRREQIVQKFGVNFIDSLIDIAQKQYVLNNINKTFEYRDCDTISRYSRAINYVDFSKNYLLDFWKNVKYPKNFKYRNEKDFYSYMSAEFILHKNGKISHLNICFSFQNDHNNKYSTYFRRKIIKFIKRSKWIPAKSAGITVTSKVPLVIHFK